MTSCPVPHYPSFLPVLYLKGLLVNKSLRPPLRALEFAEQEEMLKEEDMAKALLSATDDGEGVPVQKLSLFLQICLEKGKKKKVIGPGALCVYFMGSKNGVYRARA